MELLPLGALFATLVFYASEWATKTARVRTAASTNPISLATASSVIAPRDVPIVAQWLRHAAGALRPAAAKVHYLPRADWDRLLVTDGEGLPTLFLQMYSGELRLTEPTTGKLVRGSNHHLRRLGIWTMDLGAVGVHKIAGREGLLQPGSPMALVRESHNALDGNAIAVHAAAGRPVGY